MSTLCLFFMGVPLVDDVFGAVDLDKDLYTAAIFIPRLELSARYEPLAKVWYTDAKFCVCWDLGKFSRGRRVHSTVPSSSPTGLSLVLAKRGIILKGDRSRSSPIGLDS